MPAGAPPAPDALLAELRDRYRRVAVVHDWLTVPGGSEQVVLELLEMFPAAELFTSVYDPAPWPAQITERPVHASWLNRVPGAARHYPRLLPLMSRAFARFDLARFDLVLSSSHASAKDVRTPPGVLHVCYCHTPMRYAWEEGFLAGEAVPAALRPLLPPLLARLRRRDRAGAQGPDLFVANSRHVAARIERYYGRPAVVVNPPVDVEHYLDLAREPDPAGPYLVFGRVVPYKRADLAVAVCAALGRPLSVAGGGRALAALRDGVPDGVQLLGKVSAAERDRLFAQARALLFPGEEDFGIVPVEAQAAGMPVVAYGVGGATETVVDGRTGVLFAEQSAAALSRAIERFEALQLREQDIRENARRFGRERFRVELAGVIAQAQPRDR